VLRGAMVLSNPVTGEAHRVGTGESVFFSRDTWHHAHAVGTECCGARDLRSSSSDRLIGFVRGPRICSRTSGSAMTSCWDGTSDRCAGDSSRQHARIRAADRRWRLEPGARAVPLGLLASTGHLTAPAPSSMPGSSATGEPAAATRAATCWKASLE
jgi:hypothetical protein